MARGLLTSPRKSASQERSRATVDALVEATARILVRDGFDRASTNRIADEAGVSVGSLYQYFPGKEALVAAVIHRHNQDLIAVVRRVLGEVADQPLEPAVRRIVAAGIEAHRFDPKLHQVLAEQIPRMGAGENVGALSRETLDLLRAFLERHGDEVRVTDFGLAAWVCATSIEALTHTAVLHRPDVLSDEAAVERLVDEATRLVVGYLR